MTTLQPMFGDALFFIFQEEINRVHGTLLGFFRTSQPPPLPSASPHTPFAILLIAGLFTGHQVRPT